jgi:hypothetical protein
LASLRLCEKKNFTQTLLVFVKLVSQLSFLCASASLREKKGFTQRSAGRLHYPPLCVFLSQ